MTEITFNSVLQAQQLTDLEQKLTVAKKEMEIASLDNVRTFIIYYNVCKFVHVNGQLNEELIP